MKRISLSPELLARGIGDGAAKTLRRELREVPTKGAFLLMVDPNMPPDEVHVYHGGELQLKITNIGG